MALRVGLLGGAAGPVSSPLTAGVSVAATKARGIRAATVSDTYTAHQSVEHDDVNVMCIGAQIVGAWLAKDLITAYLGAEFSTDPDFRRRVAKLHEMDAQP